MSAVNKTYISILCLALAGLTGCGGTGQDQGSPENIDHVMSGVAIDGYLARATVFLDTNNNATRDAWEPYAFTDNDGYYSYNPISGVDYCAESATAAQSQYCLKAQTRLTDVVVRIDGGYDVLTGEPFHGQMSRRMNVDVDTDFSDAVISPITTLLTNIPGAEDREAILAAVGLEESDLDVDYLNAEGNGGINSQLLSAALKVHKTVSILADRLEDTYEGIGNEANTPNDATAMVYSRLADQLSSSGLTLDMALRDPVLLASVVNSAEQDIQAVYYERELTLPGNVNSAQSARSIQIASNVGHIVDRLISGSGGVIDRAGASGAAKALEAVVMKALDEPASGDSTIDNAVAFFAGEDNGEIITALRQSMSRDTASASQLARNEFNEGGFSSVEEIESATSLPRDAAAFNRVGGLKIKISDLDLGSAPHDLEDTEVEFYFDGASGAVEGTLIACAKHIDEANVDGTLGEGNTRGELLQGFWSLLGAREGNVESYSLLLTVNFLGTRYQSIIKPAGIENLNGKSYHALRFDFDGDIRNWHSEQGFELVDSLPASDAECRNRLPSRVGL